MIIKKLNAVFHRHSRWLFGAFTIVIIVSFLGFLTPGTFGLESVQSGDSIGIAYGKKVTYNDLRNTSLKMQIFVELVYGAQMRNMENAEIFNQFCLLAKADALGITASDKEVADLIRKVPAFQTNKEFDPAKRQDIIKKMRSNGFTEELINDSFRDQVIVSKLQNELSRGITVSDNEAETLFRSLNATNTLKIAEFKIQAPAVKNLKESEVQNYFVANRANYTIPGYVGALIVEFPYSKYLKQAQKDAADVKALEQFFRSNILEFATEKNPAPKFADVKAAVTKKFIDSKCEFLARKAGYDFASAVYEESNGKDEKTQLSTFAKKASELKYKVISAAPVKFSSETIGKIKNAELVRQLARTSGNSLVTNAVNGDKAVYVAIACNRKAPRKAELKEVAAEVKKDCAQAIGRRKAEEQAQKAFAEMMKIADPAKREAAFSKLVAKGQVKTVSCSMIDLPNDPNAYAAAHSALNLKVGEVAQPVPVAGGSILVMLSKRTPADLKKFAAEKDKYIAICRNRKFQLAVLAIQEDISKNCTFAEPQAQN